MIDTSGAELETLRHRITEEQRAILNKIWGHFRDENQWISRRALDERFGHSAIQVCYDQLGGNIIRATEEEGEERCQVTFLGVLLTGQGEESEQILARYLEYVRGQYKSDPGLEWVGSHEVEAALGLTAARSRLLRQLIRLSHWWGGGSGFGSREWTVGVPVDVDDLPAGADLRAYIREHVLTHLGTGAPASVAQRPPGEFWFVSNPDLARQLTTDWLEAQDVFQVRAWRSCVVLCGGILEALLLDALLRRGHAPPESAWSDLGELAEAARGRGIPGAETLSMSQSLRRFQDLMRPGLPAHPRPEVTKAEAQTALNAVRVCMRLMATSKDAPEADESTRRDVSSALG